jgi:hypothetical protein
LRGIGPEELARAKRELIEEWDNPSLDDAEGSPDEAWLQADRLSRPPRGGLAVAHSLNASGDVRIELRVTGARGPNVQKALKIKKHAEMQGLGGFALAKALDAFQLRLL